MGLIKTFNIVLFEPGIPQNAGNIARTCAVTGARLHLIKPLGFRLSDKFLKRAGLDYWKDVNIQTYVNWSDFISKRGNEKLWFFTASAEKTHFEANFEPDDYLVFGNENTGIPEELLSENEERCLKIPMLPGARSLNLATTAGIALYEAIRQTAKI